MAETRRLTIRRKRFTKGDLRALGAVFLAEAESARAAGRSPHVTFLLKCDDGTEYSSEDLSHFSEGAEIDFKRPSSIQFQFADTSLDRWIDLSLSHGSSRDGTMRVSGSLGYKDWVAGVFTRLQERVEAAEPSKSWFTEHAVVAYHLLALGCGSVIVFVLSSLVSVGIGQGILVLSDNSGPVEPGSVRIMFSRAPVLAYAFVWLVRWLFGGLLAPWVRDWILAAWPNVDIDAGPEHRKLEAIRRRRIATFILLGVVPLVVQFLYELASGLWRSA